MPRGSTRAASSPPGLRLLTESLKQRTADVRPGPRAAPRLMPGSDTGQAGRGRYLPHAGCLRRRGARRRPASQRVAGLDPSSPAATRRCWRSTSPSRRLASPRWYSTGSPSRCRERPRMALGGPRDAFAAANLVVATAWIGRDRLVAAGWLAPPPPARIDLPPQRLPPIERAVDHPPPDDSPAVPARTCTAFGPFQVRDEAVELGERVESSGGETRLVERTEIGEPDYLVYVEPAPSRVARASDLGRLGRAGESTPSSSRAASGRTASRSARSRAAIWPSRNGTGWRNSASPRPCGRCAEATPSTSSKRGTRRCRQRPDTTARRATLTMVRRERGSPRGARIR